MYFFLNGGHSGTPHAVPELSSKHHLGGLAFSFEGNVGKKGTL